MKQNPNQIKSEEKNMMWAIVIIIAILMLFQYIFPSRTVQNLPPSVPVQQVAEKQEEVILPTTSVIKKEKVFSVENQFVKGTIYGDGSGSNALQLTQYKETLKPDSPDVQLLTDKYSFEVNWVVQGKVLPLTLQSGKILTPDTPLVFGAQSRDLKLTRTVRIDDHYMMTFQDEIKNTSGQNMMASLTGKVVRAKGDINENRSVVHTGFVSLTNNRLQENNYSTIDEESISYQTKDGWTGITDKYWQTILIPEGNTSVEIKNTLENGDYIASFKQGDILLLSGQTLVRTTRIFAGAKDLDLINDYMKLYEIPKFDLTIDFGWFYFLTKPFLYFLQWLYSLVGNMGIAILLFATLLRLALLPVATKSYVSMAQMKKLQPQLKAIQDRYKDDRVRMQQEIMALYKREKLNPAGGCLPMLIQIPVFFALYKVLSVSLQMRQAPFVGWIQDLSMPDPSSVFTLFGLVPWPIPSFLNLGIMPVLMGITMYIQQKLTPQPAGADKAQMSLFKWMPILFTFMMGQFAVGLILYWTWSNILSIAQQKYIMRKVK